MQNEDFKYYIENDEIEEVYRGLAPIVENIAVKGPKCRRDDEISEGFEIIRKKMDTAIKHPEPVKYLVKSLKWGLIRYRGFHDTIWIPRHRYLNGERNKYVHAEHIDIESHHVNLLDMIYLEESLTCIVQDPKDQQIIKLALKGLTNQEIGEHLGMSRETVRLRRQTLKRRYYEDIN